MRYAVHAYAWTSSWSNADLGLIDHAASLGLDAIEVPLMELDAVDPGAIRDRTERVGIEVLTSVVCPEDADPSSEDERVRDGGRDFLTRCVDATADSVVYPGMADRLRTGELSLALLPINGALGNMSGPEAARFAHAIGARLAIPCHYDMFEFNTASPAVFVAECRRLGQPCEVLRAGQRLGIPTVGSSV